MTYKIETTDPVSHKHLNNLSNKPYVIEDNQNDSLIIYFENIRHRDLFLKDNLHYPLDHYQSHLSRPHL